MLIPLGLVLAYNNFLINNQPDPGCVNGCLADYTLVGIWLIIVPIVLMAMLNYHLVMKPAMMRKRNSGKKDA